MLSKCANPACSTPLLYLREGKIFMMEHGTQPQVQSEGPVLVRSGNRVEHFWLCGPCSREMTITYDDHHGIIVVAKAQARRAAAS
jgi:hypothetical protein